jgi:ferric-dicitrate binding protein FerR (iron transport regulator)
MSTADIHSLLAKYFNGEATAEERETVQQWMAASEENQAGFNLLQQLWNKSGEPQEIAFDTGKAWQAVNTRIQRPAKTIGMFGRRGVIAAAAAAVIILLGLWWLIGANFSTVTFYADTAVKEVRLRDGSQVYLRKGATLKYPKRFEENSREVSLTGEAFFEVTHDPAKPFRIKAAQAAVEVVGTSFTVNTNNDRVELVVKTGRVKFGANLSNAEIVLVSAGERASLIQNTLTKAGNTNENFNAWQSKQLVFENTPLPEVARVLSDYYQVSITINKQDAAQLAGAKLTARFNNQSLPSVLQEISLITSYRINRVSGGNYEISIK